MGLNEELEIAILEDLKEVNLLVLESYARTNKEEINLAYNQGDMDDASIESALEQAVFNRARRDYNSMIAKGRGYFSDVEHVGMPECFVYALNKGKFSEEEIKQIPFDYGDNSETFQQLYGKENLLFLLREKLLNPEPFLPSKGNDDISHPVCDCC